MTRGGKDKNSFQHSPFKTLKGLSVSGRQELPPPAPPAPAEPPLTDDDPDLFEREMAWQNVRPLAGRPPAPPAGSSAPPQGDGPAETGAAAEFVAAVGRLDKTFRDELPDDGEPPRARPRRMKQLERGELKPAAELDLHGLTRDEALSRTRTFLAHASRQGWPVVVIVTGKGLHSSEGPVLRRAVEQLLAASRELVVEWTEAPRRLGGAGALAVFVRGAP